jgi:hypothetical protein
MRAALTRTSSPHLPASSLFSKAVIHRYLWRDLVAPRRAQATPAAQQPALFTLRDDHRPAGAERDAAER